MSILEKAIAFAASAHEGQKDKGGFPYILHPMKVMSSVSTNWLFREEDILAVAVMHDVLEDTPITVKDLRYAGFSESIIELIVILTRKPKENYMDYIKRISKSRVASYVKIQDIKDNMDLSRIPNPGPKDFERREKYKLALEYLRANG